MASLKFYLKRVKEGRLQEMWRQTLWIYSYAKNNFWTVIFYTVLGMSQSLVSLGMAYVSKNLVDEITGYKFDGDLIKSFVIMIVISMITSVISQITSYISAKISMKVSCEISNDIFEKILNTDWESLTNYHTGDLLTRWGSDTGAISSGILSFIPNIFIYSFNFIIAFWVLIKNDWTFIIFAFAGMPVSILLSKTLLKRMVNNNKRAAEMSARLSGFNQETFSNIQTIKAFDLIKLYTDKLKKNQQDVIDMKLEFQRMSMGTSLLMTFVSLIVSNASYGWGIYRVWSGSISYGTMTLFLSQAGNLTTSTRNLTSLIPSIISLTTSAGRLMDIVEMPREDYSDNDKVTEFASKYKEEGVSLVLKDVKYAYANGTLVFEGADIEARPHEIIGLVGPSGEGKTTMLRLLLSLMKTQDGSAEVISGDGSKSDAEHITLTPATRKLFSYVPQGNTMLSGTIAENMRNVKQDATDEEIIEALKAACAWEFVEKLPEGINSMIKERGGGFSEGQAQRLSIARSLLRKSPILLLDEATSALDVATERKVLKNIMKDEYPRTCIVTTHRPTVLSACERVYAIRDKKCVVLDQDEIDEMSQVF
ncbi:MAG: ABC transporter ATP-binding protein/permease [Lachnospiraceae bacterium]|nr:ABC transporter ATP-binding protein/permease [Lachnospiraceae bacterium]